tara:strand:+ start:3527 stop:4360 length:834 start_codon:yes stop_codon:yes gene_type:complete
MEKKTNYLYLSVRLSHSPADHHQPRVRGGIAPGRLFVKSDERPFSEIEKTFRPERENRRISINKPLRFRLQHSRAAPTVVAMPPASPPGSAFSEEDYYVPAGTAPFEQRVRGRSLKDVQLYGSDENVDVFKAQRERQLALRHQSQTHARVMQSMRQRQKETPVGALRQHIQRTSRHRLAKDLAPETVRRVAASAGEVSFVGAHQSFGDREPANATRDDGMRHLPEVPHGGVINPDKARSMATRVAKQLARVQSPHLGWESAKAAAGPRRKSGGLVRL